MHTLVIDETVMPLHTSNFTTKVIGSAWSQGYALPTPVRQISRGHHKPGPPNVTEDIVPA